MHRGDRGESLNQGMVQYRTRATSAGACMCSSVATCAEAVEPGYINRSKLTWKCISLGETRGLGEAGGDGKLRSMTHSSVVLYLSIENRRRMRTTIGRLKDTGS